MALHLPLLSVGPRIHKEGGRLVITTAWRVRFLTLGMLYRQVVIDPGKKLVRIRRRYLWCLGRRLRIPFARIEAVTYGYADWSADSWSWAHHSYDVFSVGLRLIDRQQLHLATFFGEGAFQNNGPLPDWFYWSEFAFDLAGTQEAESRAFAELLAHLIGVSIIPPSY